MRAPSALPLMRWQRSWRGPSFFLRCRLLICVCFKFSFLTIDCINTCVLGSCFPNELLLNYCSQLVFGYCQKHCNILIYVCRCSLEPSLGCSVNDKFRRFTQRKKKAESLYKDFQSTPLYTTVSPIIYNYYVTKPGAKTSIPTVSFL
jgi:hypothetical protein